MAGLARHHHVSAGRSGRHVVALTDCPPSTFAVDVVAVELGDLGQQAVGDPTAPLGCPVVRRLGLIGRCQRQPGPVLQGWVQRLHLLCGTGECGPRPLAKATSDRFHVARTHLAACGLGVQVDTGAERRPVAHLEGDVYRRLVVGPGKPQPVFGRHHHVVDRDQLRERFPDHPPDQVTRVVVDLAAHCHAASSARENHLT